MNKNSKQALLLVLFFSIGLHICLLLLLLFKQIDNPINKKTDIKKKEAKIIFKDPKKKQIKPKFTAGKSHGAPFLQPQTKNIAQQKPIQSLKKIEPQKKLEKLKQPLQPKNHYKPHKVNTRAYKNLKTLALPHKKFFPMPKPKIEKEKKLTLADLTKKVLAQAQRHGATRDQNSNHLINITGKNRGKATADQLKHERYIAKLFECMQTSFKLFQPSFRFTIIPTTQSLVTAINLNLDTKGKIIDLQLVQSSGCTQYDLFVMKVIKNAGTSFPPLPEYFKTHRYFVPMQFHTPTYALMRRQPQPHIPV